MLEKMKKRNGRRNLAQASRYSLKSALPLIFFLCFVFLLGGASRSDIASVPLLRGGSLLFAFWAATQMRKEDWVRIAVPLGLLVAASVWMALQLVPLPPEAWQALPGREIVADTGRLLGEDDLWRPLSLAPSQTLNSLLAMTVPFATLLLAARVRVEDISYILFAFVGIACVSALLGFVQLLSDGASGAYLYRITNADAMVGLFANRNHHAIFMACALMIAGTLLRDEFLARRQRGATKFALLIAAVMFASLTIFIGSRAGLIGGICVILIVYLTLAFTLRGTRVEVSPTEKKRFGGWAQLAILALPALLLFLTLNAALWADRTTALSRLADQDMAADLRVRAWPTVSSMLETFWIWGSGFGSFPDVYKIFEPDNLLAPGYFNHAHNDWVEVLLTGGLPFALILLLTLLWLVRQVVGQGIRTLLSGRRGDYRLMALVVIFLLAGSSVVDYPLRVPSMQAMAIALVLLVFCPSSRAFRRHLSLKPNGDSL
ncbi:O-antigen ligase family protein [Sphingopyxis macrogoltabida]|uniref:O-antigen ligase-related domain-containing protein n=1 Tax=Sphingopyxis macrogoltabida TaxID=33050 RepID=A0AAC9AXP7_SPHMC|nr:O-antigen ligase family protein [Sphingopyxis macrogoltabida]ALJ15655.1 hypothetical protein LH19_22505 [Sphingopyxis macrogoltabida]AMU91896.1 hypothetical protein ATM17_23065 [Sphingopyxis macrogoltabida]